MLLDCVLQTQYIAIVYWKLAYLLCDVYTSYTVVNEAVYDQKLDLFEFL